MSEQFSARPLPPVRPNLPSRPWWRYLLALLAGLTMLGVFWVLAQWSEDRNRQNLNQPERTGQR